MINRVEAGSPQAPIDAQPVSESPLDRVNRALPNMTSKDAFFVERMIDLFEDPKSIHRPKVFNSLVELVDLSTAPQALKRQKERQSAQRVDIMETMEPFSPEERVIIAKNLGSIQMTDGCTVGCTWCGVEAKRSITKAFSLESYKRFIIEFGKYIPNRKGVSFGLYGASDPFDWVSEDGKSDYGTLDKFYRDNTRGKQIITSTAVPVGAEVSIASFLVPYLIRNFERAKKGKRLHEYFRFSVTKDNKYRVLKIMQFIKDLRFIPEKYLRNFILLLDRSEEIGWEDIEPNDEDAEIKIGSVKNVGYFAYKPDRSDSDRVGIACQDSLDLSPFYTRNMRGREIQYGGLIASSMECVTMQNSVGERRIPVVPGRMMIPKHITDIEYEFPSQFNPKGKNFPILPKHRYHVYEDGKFVGSEDVESVRRDGLAFYWAYLNLTDWDILVPGEENFDSALAFDGNSFFDEMNKFAAEFEKRKKSSTALFESEPDKEAVNFAKKYIQEIESWIIDLHARVEKSNERIASRSD